MAEYKEIVINRIQNLTEEERDLLVSIEETPAGRVVMSVLGPELFGSSTQEQATPAQPTPPVRQGLGAR